MIGATVNPNKWGFRILANILGGGYRGHVYPVNPKGGDILGLKAFLSVKDIPSPVDLAVICIPSHLVPSAIKDCAVRGIGSAIIITSGFAEIGKEGEDLEKEVSGIAQEHGLRFVGPNTMGVFSAGSSLHALMPPLQPKDGGVSYVSQSGNLGVQMLDWGEERGVGFCKFVSSGTEGDIRTEEYIEYFATDPDTRVILTYIEGLDDGRSFFRSAKRAAREKPVIVFKSGKTQEGTRAAKSHSGAMAGTYSIYESAFRQAGIIHAKTTDTMLDYAAAFLHLPLPRGNRIVLMTRGGGWGVVAADACRQNGLALPPLSDSLIRTMNEVLPVYWSHGNPVDLAATLNPEAFPACLEALITEDGVDGVIALGVDFGKRTRVLSERVRKIGGADREDQKEESIAAPNHIHMAMDMMEAYDKPVVMVSGINSYARTVSYNNRETVIFSTPERAAGAMAKLCEYSRFLRKESE